MITKQCQRCNKDFERFPCQFKNGRGIFCSRKCYLKYMSDLWKTSNPMKGTDQSGKNNPMYGKIPHNYKADGSTRKDGYITLTVNGKKVLKHRLIVEKHIGRRLLRSEIVHHIDGNNTNNDITNLLIMTQSEHINLHRKDLQHGESHYKR